MLGLNNNSRVYIGYHKCLADCRSVLRLRDHVISNSVVSVDPGNKVLEWPVDGKLLHADTITLDFASLLELVEFRHSVGGKAVSARNENDLTTSEFEAGSVQSLLGVFDELGFGSDRDEHLIDGDASGLDVGLTKSTAHTLLESISTSARQHLVDADGVPRVHSHSHVESVFGGLGDHVFVGRNTGGLK